MSMQVLLVFSWVIMFAPPTQVQIGVCGTTAAKVGTIWQLACSNNCGEAQGPGGTFVNQCVPTQLTDAIGTYTTCACEAGGSEGQGVPACCTTVLRNGEPQPRGTCNPGIGCPGGECVDQNERDAIADFGCEGQ